jgi:hypothetical protein
LYSELLLDIILWLSAIIDFLLLGLLVHCVAFSSFMRYEHRHERDSRQSQSRSGEILKLSRRHFSGFREKVLFSLVKAAGKLRLGTTLNGTQAVHFFTFERSGRGTEQTQKCRLGNGKVPLGYVQL